MGVYTGSAIMRFVKIIIQKILDMLMRGVIMKHDNERGHHEA